MVAPLALALAWRLGALSARELRKSLAVVVGGLAAATLARFAYYGALLPNTWSAKPPTLRSALGNLADLAAGTAVNVGFPFAGLWALGLVAAGRTRVDGDRVLVDGAAFPRDTVVSPQT